MRAEHRRARWRALWPAVAYYRQIMMMHALLLIMSYCLIV